MEACSASASSAPPRRLAAGWLLAAGLALAACAGGPAPRRFEYARIVMGVEARIILYCPDEAAARAAAKAAFGRMGVLEQALSDWRADSELMRAAAAAHERPVALSEDLWRVLVRAREVSEASGGAFDVTVGPLVALWREARRTGRLPDAQAHLEARAGTGWRHMRLDAQGRTLRLERPGMQLDLGAIGKGYAADEALGLLRAAGVPQALVALGGDIAAGAPPPGASAWRVAVASAAGGTLLCVPLAHAGIAQSGHSVQFLEVGGVRYSHLIDPRTGLGLTGANAVTVVAPDATIADALASAVCVLGAQQGLALVDRFPGASALIEVQADDGPRFVASAGFPLEVP